MQIAEARERLDRAVDFRGDTARVTVRRADLKLFLASCDEQPVERVHLVDGKPVEVVHVVDLPIVERFTTPWEYWAGAMLAIATAACGGWFAHGG